MDVGIDFFITGSTIDPLTLAQAVEDHGFDSLWLPEHVAIPTGVEPAYHRGTGEVPPVYGEFVDPLVALAWCGSATSALKLATGVCLVAERHPLLLAKCVASLDRLSGGRVLLGVGGGWHATETELFGVAFADRWRYIEESVGAMRALWRSGVASYAGEHVSFPEVRSEPLPASDDGPPVLIGGPATPATLRRVARWADGWVPLFLAPKQLAAARAGLARECANVGRDVEEIEISAFVMDASPRIQDAYAAAGASRLIVQAYNHPGGEFAFADWESHYVRAAFASSPTPDDTLRTLDALSRRAFP